MSLISAGLNALGGTLASQWKEYIYVDALPENVLAARAMKKTKSRFGGSRVEDDNVITEGSVIAVADGQCMMIVDQGKVVDFCAEPGEYVFSLNGEPSLLVGPFSGDKVRAVLKETFERFSFGGQAGKDQRVYFFNTKEILGNKYGTPSPVPFRVVDRNIGLDIDIAIRCFGEYSYKITDPLLFYTNVCANVTDTYTRDRIDSQLKSELMTALQPAFAKISDMGIRYSALPGHTQEIADALNEVLSSKWAKLRGISVASFGVSSVKASEEDEAMIKNLQRTAVMRDPTMAAATLTGAQAQAIQDAAKNTATGPMFAFAGLDMANRAGGMNAQSLYQMGQNQQAQQPAQQPAPQAAPADGWTCSCGAVNTGKFCAQCGAKKPEPKPAEGSWTCTCGHVNTGKFCMECGAKKPEPKPDGWVCPGCGRVNKGKFCPECGAKKPAEAKLYTCDKCGWEPADPEHPPKFCPECGDPFDDSDAK